MAIHFNEVLTFGSLKLIFCAKYLNGSCFQWKNSTKWNWVSQRPLSTFFDKALEKPSSQMAWKGARRKICRELTISSFEMKASSSPPAIDNGKQCCRPVFYQSCHDAISGTARADCSQHFAWPTIEKNLIDRFSADGINSSASCPNFHFRWYWK